jgi:acyl-coenzyme A synthetase/AMP-(fatty) acid ligase
LPGQGFVDVDADHAALITFTSGSTGRPKGVVRSAGFLALQHSLLEGIRGTTPEHVDLISLPVFVLSNLVAGATSVIPAGNLRRPASLNGRRIIAQMRATGVNRIVAPPAVCARIAEAAQAGAGPLELEAMFTGGGPVFPNLLHALHAAAPGARIHAVYGSTEAEPIAHVRYDDVGAADWTAMARGAGLLAGAPVPQAAVEIVDDEIQVSGPHVNRGYLDPAQDATTKVTRDGRLWHRTGDAARFDERGRLWLLGRREAAGGGLFPFAVETAALSWRGVRQAALVAREGRRPTLCLAGEGLDEAALRLRASTLGELEVRLMRRIPMDARHNSKVDYAALRRRLGRAA